MSLYGNHNRVDHCYLKGKKNLGTTLVVWLDANPNYHQIDSNHFGPRPELGVNGGETIRVGTSDWSLYNSYTTVEYNLFEECNGEIEAISNKSCGNIYRYNTFLSCQATLTLRHGSRCSVYGNFFFGNHKPNSGGIRIIGEDHLVYNNYIAGTSGGSFKSALTIMNGIPNSPLSGYYQVKRAVVAFNTLVDNVNNFNIGAYGDTSVSLPPLDCTIANNIISGTTSPLVLFNTQPVNMQWYGNIFHGVSPGFATMPVNNYLVNPNFASADSNGVIHLQSNSPAINKSIGTFSYVLTDIDGQNRDTIKDSGCDEYSTAAPKIKPLKPGDVGTGTSVLSAIQLNGRVEKEFALYQNFPNPFNPSTTIKYSIPREGRVTVTIYNSMGKKIREVQNKIQRAGEHAIIFSSTGLPTGVYFFVVGFGGFYRAGKMVLLK
ncbi:MAG: T9SS type A sorting domain-containing protein [Ignavibacteriales bacterium]|nr:T9SS type A sorting domain-containing protein [Ignavibacteriales bacterium]